MATKRSSNLTARLEALPLLLSREVATGALTLEQAEAQVLSGERSADCTAFERTMRLRQARANENVVRLAKMLETAAAEQDWQVKWARVNRAAGIVSGLCTAGLRPEADAATFAERLVSDVALVADLPHDTLCTLVEGLGKRVALALVEWYKRGAVVSGGALLPPAAAGAMVLRVTRGSRVKDIPVETVNEASSWWCRYRDEHGSRSSTAPRLEIVVDGVPRGYVSFNGKVWEGRPEDWKPGAVPVFCP